MTFFARQHFHRITVKRLNRTEMIFHSHQSTGIILGKAPHTITTKSLPLFAVQRRVDLVQLVQKSLFTMVDRTTTKKPIKSANTSQQHALKSRKSFFEITHFQVQLAPTTTIWVALLSQLNRAPVCASQFFNQ